MRITHRTSTRIRQWRRRRSGAALLELAILMPVWLMLIFAQIETSRLCMVQQILNTAARQGCRVSVINGKTNSDVTTTINAVLTSGGLTGVTTTLNPTDCTTAHISSSPTTNQVTLSVGFSSVCWPSPSTYFSTATLTATATMSSERP